MALRPPAKRGRRPCASPDRTRTRPSPRRRRRGARRRARSRRAKGRAPRAAGAAAALRTVGGIDALIALQGLEDPTERRKQAVKRGRVALDALDELKIGLLGGTLVASRPWASCSRPPACSRTARATPASTAVLGEIELRVEVEIAKMAPALNRQILAPPRPTAGPAARAGVFSALHTQPAFRHNSVIVRLRGGPI